MSEELGAIKWRIDVDTTDLGRAEKEMDKAGETVARTGKKVTDSAKEVEKSHKAAAASVKQLAAAYLGFQAMRVLAGDTVKYADSWKLVNNQLRQVTASETQLRQVRAQLLQTSKDTNSELRVTTDLYSGLFRATRSLNTSQQEVATVTKTINNLFKAGGKPAAETSGAIRQLTQGLEAGALRGDEFNSVAEGAPRIMDAMAKHLKMTRGELREFAATGGITAKIMVDALSSYEAEAQRLADLTEETFGQKMVNATTNLTEFAGEANALSGSVNVAGDSIVYLSENLDTVSALAATVALIMAGRYVTSMAAAATATIATSSATVTFGSALAAIGGPVGLAMLAAAGVGMLVLRQKELAEQNWAVATSFDAVLSRLNTMTQDELVSEAMGHQLAAEEIKKKMRAFEVMGATSESTYKKMADDLDRENDKIRVLVGAIQRLRTETDKGAGAVDKFTAAEQESINAIALQRAQMAMSGREAAIFKKVLEEYSKGTGPEAIAVIAEQTGKLYDEEQQTKANTEAKEALVKVEEDLQDRRMKATLAIAEQIATMKTEMVLIQMSSRQRAIAEALITASNEAHKASRELTGKETAGIVANTAALYDQQAALDATKKAQEDAAEAAKKTAAEAAKAQKEALEDIEKANARVWNKIDDVARDTFVSIGSDIHNMGDAFDTLEETVKNGLLALLYEMTLKKWVINVGTSFSGSGAASQLFGASGGLSGGSLLSSASALSNGLAGSLAPWTSPGAKITDAQYQQFMGGDTTKTGLNLTDLKSLGLSIGAGIAGGFVGNKAGEALFGKQAESNWGATAGGIIGGLGGPLGAFIGSAIGSMVDVAFGGDGKQRNNAGFLAGPTPGLKDEYDAGDHTFASGLKVKLFARRSDPGAAKAIVDVFDQVDTSFADLVKELGGKISVSSLQGLDEEARAGSTGTFFGVGGNGTTQGDIKAQVNSYIDQLADHVTGLKDPLLESIKAATSAEEVLTLLTAAVAENKSEEEKKAKAEQERTPLLEELLQLTKTQTELEGLKRESLEESNRTLYDQVLAARKAKAVEEERLGLQAEIADMTMTSAEKLQRQRDALDESNRALFDNIQLIKESTRAEDARKAGFENALNAAKDFFDDVRDQQKEAIRDHYSDLIDKERDLHNRRMGLLKSLTDATTNLRLGNLSVLSPRDQLAFAQSRFRGFASTALDASKSMEDRVTAAEGLKDSYEAYVSAGQKVNASSAAQKQIVAEVLQTLDAAKFLGTKQEFDPGQIQNEMLNELKKLNDQTAKQPTEIAAVLASLITQAMLSGKSNFQISNIGKEIRTDYGDKAGDEFDKAQESMTGQKSQPITDAQIQMAIQATRATSSTEREQYQQLAALAQANNVGLSTIAKSVGIPEAEISAKLDLFGIPKFAEGGWHAGGLAMVGEEGPELMELPAGRIHSNGDSQSMLAANDASLAKISSQLDQLIKLTVRIGGEEDRRMADNNDTLRGIKAELTSNSGTGTRRYRKVA